MVDPSVSEHGRTWERRFSELAYQEALRDLLGLTLDSARRAVELAGVPENHVVISGRVKDPESFALKASKVLDDDPSVPRYHYPCEDITDQVAVRVMTLLADEADQVARCLPEVPGLRVRESTPRPVERGRFGYMSIHRLVDLGRHDDCPPAPGDHVIPHVEVQIRTQLQHVWAEIEHDTRYKGNADPAISRRFDQLAAMIELADQLLQEAAEASVEHTPPPADGTLSLAGLRRVLDTTFPEARSSNGQAQEWLLPHPVALGLDTEDRLSAALEGLDLEAIESVFVDAGTGDRGQVRCLDDALLAYGGDRYVLAAETDLPDPTRGTRRSRVRGLRRRLELLREHGIATD